MRVPRGLNKKITNSKKTMKDERINLKVSPEEKKLLRKAAKNLNFETGAKENISEVIRHSVKKYAEIDLTKPEMFFCDRDGVKGVARAINFALISLQKFLNEFKAVTGQVLSLAELEKCFERLGKLGSTAIIHETIREVVNTKLYDQLVKEYPKSKMTITTDNIPYKDLSKLFEAADEVENVPGAKIGMPPFIYWWCFSVNGGIISVIPEEVEKLKNNYRFYANSPEELHKLQKVKSLCQVLNEIMEDPEVLADKIFTLVYFDAEARKFSPTGSYIKYSLAPRIHFERLTT